MTPLQLTILLVAVVAPITLHAQNSCPAQATSCSTYTNIALTPTTNNLPNDHYYIGGLSDIHERVNNAYQCDSARISSKGLLNLEAFHYAIREYGPLIHGDVSIGGVSLDSCSRTEQTLENILSFEVCKVRLGSTFPVSPRNLLAYVGPSTNMDAMAASRLLTDMNKTMISHAATSPMLNDRVKHPFFLRTVPHDNYNPKIISAILGKFNIKYVMLIYQDNEFGMNGYMELKKHLEPLDVCIAYKKEVDMDTDLSEVAKEVLEKKMIRYVIVYADKEMSQKIVKSVYDRDNIEVGNLVFLGTSKWGKDGSITFNANIVAYTPALGVPSGSAASNDLKSDVDSFYQEVDSWKHSENTWNQKWFKAFWDQQCVGCANDDTLAGKYEQDENVPYTLLATKAIIQGIRDAAGDICGSPTLCSTLMNTGDKNRGQAIFDKINKTDYFNGYELSDTFVSYNIYKFQGSAMTMVRFDESF